MSYRNRFRLSDLLPRVDYSPPLLANYKGMLSALPPCFLPFPLIYATQLSFSSVAIRPPPQHRPSVQLCFSQLRLSSVSTAWRPIGLPQSAIDLEAYVVGDGPFDGVMAFSQGARLATSNVNSTLGTTPI